jgi:hypothetical protein
MATQGRGKKLPAKTSLPTGDYYIPPVPVAVAPVRESVWEDIVGWIAAVILVGLLLPMGAILYMDILQVKNEVKQQLEKVEKLRRQIEAQQRKDKDK